eukprot:scaffold7052_cov254-Pinguiococcus_pyrenoidosus.AAC.19
MASFCSAENAFSIASASSRPTSFALSSFLLTSWRARRCVAQLDSPQLRDFRKWTTVQLTSLVPSSLSSIPPSPSNSLLRRMLLLSASLRSCWKWRKATRGEGSAGGRETDAATNLALVAEEVHQLAPQCARIRHLGHSVWMLGWHTSLDLEEVESTTASASSASSITSYSIVSPYPWNDDDASDVDDDKHEADRSKQQNPESKQRVRNEDGPQHADTPTISAKVYLVQEKEEHDERREPVEDGQHEQSSFSRILSVYDVLEAQLVGDDAKCSRQQR